MFKFVVVLSALIAVAAAKPGLLAAAPLAYAAPAGVVTATSSQVFSRNHNGIAAASYIAAPAAPLAVAAPLAAPVAAAPFAAPYAVASPLTAAPVAASPYIAAPYAAAPLAYSAPLTYASAPVFLK